jgi:hypothetical protein
LSRLARAIFTPARGYPAWRAQAAVARDVDLGILVRAALEGKPAR